MYNNGIFQNNQNTNPFLPSSYSNFSSTQDQLANSLYESYAKLEALKQKQQALSQSQFQPRTVFTDISDELNGLSADEISFIVNSKEYQALNATYQSEFSQFLINKFSNEYLQVGNTKTLEEILGTIKKQKEKYSERFSADINEIRDQNKNLLDKNNELAAANEELQSQLRNIEEKLNKRGFKNE